MPLWQWAARPALTKALMRGREAVLGTYTPGPPAPKS